MRSRLRRMADVLVRWLDARLPYPASPRAIAEREARTERARVRAIAARIDVEKLASYRRVQIGRRG